MIGSVYKAMPVTYVPMHLMPCATATKEPDMGERHTPPKAGEFAYFEIDRTAGAYKERWIVQTEMGEVGAHFSCAERSLEIPHISCNGMIQQLIRRIGVDGVVVIE